MNDTCRRGHPRIPENVYQRPSGAVTCRICEKTRIRGRTTPVLFTSEWAPVPRLPGATCREAPHLPWTDDEARAGDTTEMHRVCMACPVIDDCLAWALKGSEVGFWGGTTRRQRSELHVLSRQSSSSREGLVDGTMRVRMGGEGA